MSAPTAMGPVEPPKTAALSELTDRQLECLRLIGEGMSSKEIGRALGISPSTVDNHIHAAVAKLHVKNRWQAAKLLHPERSNGVQGEDRRPRLIPPIGGQLNHTSIKGRLLQIVSITIVSIVVVAALIASIIAAIQVFNRM